MTSSLLNNVNKYRL